MLARSNLLGRVAQVVGRVGAPFYLYADPAYGMSMYLLRGYKGAMTPQQRAFSTEMSRLRESVEWGFALVIADWKYIDFKKNLKLLRKPIGKFYYSGVPYPGYVACPSLKHEVMTAQHLMD